MTTPYEPETTGEIEYVPGDDNIDLAMLANDINEVLANDEYGFDVHDHTVAAALPAFIAELRKMSCPEARAEKS